MDTSRLLLIIRNTTIFAYALMSLIWKFEVPWLLILPTGISIAYVIRSKFTIMHTIQILFENLSLLSFLISSSTNIWFFRLCILIIIFKELTNWISWRQAIEIWRMNINEPDKHQEYVDEAKYYIRRRLIVASILSYACFPIMLYYFLIGDLIPFMLYWSGCQLINEIKGYPIFFLEICYDYILTSIYRLDMEKLTVLRDQLPFLDQLQIILFLIRFLLYRCLFYSIEIIAILCDENTDGWLVFRLILVAGITEISFVLFINWFGEILSAYAEVFLARLIRIDDFFRHSHEINIHGLILLYSQAFLVTMEKLISIIALINIQTNYDYYLEILFKIVLTCHLVLLIILTWRSEIYAQTNVRPHSRGEKLLNLAYFNAALMRRFWSIHVQIYCALINKSAQFIVLELIFMHTSFIAQLPRLRKFIGSTDMSTSYQIESFCAQFCVGIFFGGIDLSKLIYWHTFCFWFLQISTWLRQFCQIREYRNYMQNRNENREEITALIISKRRFGIANINHVTLYTETKTVNVYALNGWIQIKCTNENASDRLIIDRLPIWKQYSIPFVSPGFIDYGPPEVDELIEEKCREMQTEFDQMGPVYSWLTNSCHDILLDIIIKAIQPILNGWHEYQFSILESTNRQLKYFLIVICFYVIFILSIFLLYEINYYVISD